MVVGRDGHLPMRKRFRHGKCRLFHLYHAFCIGESGFDGIVRWSSLMSHCHGCPPLEPMISKHIWNHDLDTTSSDLIKGEYH